MKMMIIMIKTQLTNNNIQKVCTANSATRRPGEVSANIPGLRFSFATRVFLLRSCQAMARTNGEDYGEGHKGKRPRVARSYGNGTPNITAVIESVLAALGTATAPDNQALVKAVVIR